MLINGSSLAEIVNYERGKTCTAKASNTFHLNKQISNYISNSSLQWRLLLCETFPIILRVSVSKILLLKTSLGLCLKNIGIKKMQCLKKIVNIGLKSFGLIVSGLRRYFLAVKPSLSKTFDIKE